MEAADQYLADITRMWQFVEAFTVRATHVFKVKRVKVEEYPEFGGPLVCYFFMHAYEEMPSAAAVLALAEPLRDFPFKLTCEAVEDPGTEFNELLCYFCLAVDWGRDVYFIRKSDDF